MITFEEAEGIAGQTLVRESRPEIQLQLIPEHTIEKPYGWVFFYQSANFLRTVNFSDFVIGNAPFLVTRAEGKVIFFGTARSIEWYLDQYERGKWPEGTDT